MVERRRIMQFQLTKEFLDALKVAYQEGNESFVREHCMEMHPADIAEIITELNIEESKFVFRHVEDTITADVLMELDEDVRERFLKALSAKEIAIQVDQLDSDDAADLVGELDDDLKEEVIANLEDLKSASEIVDLLKYDENSAGGLMQKEFIKARMNWPVNRCVIELRRQAEDVENVYSIYVVDEADKLVGILSLKRLLFANPKTLIGELYQQSSDLRYVQAEQPKEEVAKMMEKYDLVAMPVIDRIGRLIGRITIDDVVDVIKEEADKDYQMASGLSEKVESSTSLWKTTRSRIPWLLIGLLGGILSSQVIQHYEYEITINPALAFFMPLIAAMGGNVGVQSSAIVVQGLANKSIDFGNIFTKVSKEALVGIINGIICGVLIFAFNYFLMDDFKLGLTVSLALLSVIIFAACFGTLVPLVLDRYKIDPALATGPFITTMNDVIGLFIYFSISILLY